ncbi:reverse transcriptase family protein [Bergeyella cardium]|uniref:RNA-directed DNA polymerase n=1 Tax=Bergeyella cardium TaxID=1585976 RepID=A0A6P1QVW9_9FLAO|nr:reverse transcriptase family protein [Bergeyella cardium]QHN65949.1 hypothetical protein DBX24_08680 [Bergeyella cardium]WHE33554.1 reverse transcriptase family protein [Bergeyella cardium]WHF60204.1 reverse transcriptase family protein [Bergeyella cardium]
MTSPSNKTIEDYSAEYQNEINAYQSVLNKNNLPVIYSLNHLCLMAEVNFEKIKIICDSNRQDSYKRFKLRKKRGGFRVIQTPQDELKYLQRWILENILNKKSSHNACKGFDPNTSIKLNAEKHLGQDGILKIDLLRFYDSINEKRVYGLFKSLGYHPNLSVSLAKICTIVPDNTFLCSFKKKERHLKQKIQRQSNLGVVPQGAPSSPKISNLIAISLDNRLQKLANKHDLNYTRYADDLTFSGKIEILSKIKKAIYRIIKEENLYPNYSKTKILKRGNPFFVTGLSVHNNIVTVPKKKKLEIEHHLHHCIKNGVQSHLITSKITNRNFKDWLLGNIAFVNSVEKELGEKYFKQFNEIQWPI